MEEQRRAEQRAAAKTDGMKKQGRKKTNKTGSRMGERMDRQGSVDLSAPGALNNNSVPIDPNESGD